MKDQETIDRLKTDLGVAQFEIKELRQERDNLKRKLELLEEIAERLREATDNE
jgi:septal ring factor EnvC (AmiA/AmiB activator)